MHCKDDTYNIFHVFTNRLIYFQPCLEDLKMHELIDWPLFNSRTHRGFESHSIRFELTWFLQNLKKIFVGLFCYITLKGHWHEILELQFFPESKEPRPQINIPKKYWKYFRFRGEIHENISVFHVTIPGSRGNCS